MATASSKLPKFFVSLLTIVTMNALALSGNIKPAHDSSISDTIRNSLVGTAHAESEFFSTTIPNGTGCWNASFTNNLVPCPVPADEITNICIKENATNGLPVYYYVSNDVPSSSIIEVLLNNPTITPIPPTGLLINPVFQSTTNPYLTNFSRLDYLTNLTAPAVPFASSPILTTLTFDGDFIAQTGGGQNRNLTHLVQANVRMEHINTGPTLSNLSPTSYNQVLSGSTINLPVSAYYADNENNHSNVIFELSNDNFSTILQTETFSAVSSGTTLNKTFTNLGVGSYQWRVRAAETDALGNCIGYPNQDPPINLSTIAGPQNIVLTGSSLASTGADRTKPLALSVVGILASLFALFKAHKLINKKLK